MAETGFFFIYGKRLRRKLEEAGAVSENMARTINELGLSSREIRTLKRNVWIGKVKEIVDKRGEKRYFVPPED